MNSISIIFEIIKTLIPFFVNILAYYKGKSDKEKEIMLEVKDDLIEHLKEKNEIITKLKDMDKRDYTNNIDDMFDRL
jgi:hypothetical protein